MVAAAIKRFVFGAEPPPSPVFDGVMRPNQDLDLCSLLARGLDKPDDVSLVGGEAVVSAGSRILHVTGHWFAPLKSVYAAFEGTCGALAALPDGGLAVALDGNRIAFVGGRQDGKLQRKAGKTEFGAITAIAVDGDRMLIAEGSDRNTLDGWRRDLFQRGRSGRVVELDLISGSSAIVAEGLAWAGGVAVTPAGGILVSESWAHRVRSLSGPIYSFENIPAYPGRICAAADGGFWLSCFAARTQLVDFVLADQKLSERMMREVDEEFWIAPTLAASDHLHEPTQLGGVKQYGAKKAWAPARSYGLVIRLDAGVAPVASLHSRVDGKRHGITGVAAAGSTVFITSKGNGKLLRHEDGEEGGPR